MIFIVNSEPFAAVQFQNQLKSINNNSAEVYLSTEETEQNLYKHPDIILLDENLGLADLLYLTQSIKAYDASIQIIWICNPNSSDLKKMYRSYGVMQCLAKGEYFLERLSLTIIEARETLTRSKGRQNRIEHLRQNILNMATDQPAGTVQNENYKLKEAKFFLF